MLTIAELLTQIKQKYSVEMLPQNEVEMIFAKVLELSRAQIKAWPEKVIAPTQCKQIENYCARRANGEPIAYIFSEREFWSLNFYVNKSVLIPRHETENLIEYCLTQYDKQSRINCIDLGTGSGAIALALASEFPNWNILAIDRCIEALSIARFNGEQHKVTTVNYVCADWLTAIQVHSVELIISNPPYIGKDEIYLQQGDLPFEPQHALVAENEGLADLYQIITQAKQVLRVNGKLILEHGHEQGLAVRECMLKHGYQKIETIQDYSNLDRFTIGIYCD